MKLVHKRQQKETDHLKADLARVEQELNILEDENPLFIDEAWLEQKRVLEIHRDKLVRYIEEREMMAEEKALE